MRQFDTSESSIETSQLVVDGYMFMTLTSNRVEVFDARIGANLAALSGLALGMRNRVGARRTDPAGVECARGEFSRVLAGGMSEIELVR